MLYGTLLKIGGAISPVVGPIHDALGGKDAPQSSDVLSPQKPEQKLLVEYFIGGTALVGLLLGFVVCKMMGKKPVRRRRRRTTPVRRRTYRRTTTRRRR
jgi:hypothetical protein